LKKLALQTVEQVVVTEIVCDRCERAFDADDVFELQEFVHVRIDGGFASIFGDGTQLTCDLCQRCVRAVLGAFLKPPAQMPGVLPNDEDCDEVSNPTE
jgi:hypothetical protein